MRPQGKSGISGSFAILHEGERDLVWDVRGKAGNSLEEEKEQTFADKFSQGYLETMGWRGEADKLTLLDALLSAPCLMPKW